MSLALNNEPIVAEHDFDLHGLVGIRLIGAAPCDVAAVRRQVGPVEGSLVVEPDIVIRFVDRLPVSSRLRYLGLDDVGFTDDAFVVLRSKHKSRARVQIRFEEIGERCEIICERGLAAVPLLIPIVNLVVLAKGLLPLHASAFAFDGTGVVTTGWSKGGKTEALLAFMAHGADYIGDEWVYVSGDGTSVYGIPQPIRVWDWHLRDLPQYRALVSGKDRLRLRAIKLLQAMQGVGRVPGLSRLGPVKLLNRLGPLLKQQLYLDMEPEQLFCGGAASLSGSFDRLFFVASHESAEIVVEPIDPLQVAQRMVSSLQHERLDFMAYYWKFRFAFPDVRNELIERAEELERERLERMFADKPAYAVYHPYPVPVPALFDAMCPFV